MNTIDISEARKQFNHIDQQLKTQPVIMVTRHKKNAFVIVSLDYYSVIMETIEILADPQAIQMLKDSIEDIRAGRLYEEPNG